MLVSTWRVRLPTKIFWFDLFLVRLTTRCSFPPSIAPDLLQLTPSSSSVWLPSTAVAYLYPRTRRNILVGSGRADDSRVRVSQTEQRLFELPGISSLQELPLGRVRPGDQRGKLTTRRWERLPEQVGTRSCFDAAPPVHRPERSSCHLEEN